MLHDELILDIPWAVVDVETTGLSGADEIIEVCVFRIEPGSTQPRRVFDTLIRPAGAIGATRIHGLREEDLTDAPPFHEVAHRLSEALCGSILVAHNASFDSRFLQSSLGQCGVDYEPPTICTMSLTKVLGVPVSKHDLASVAAAYQVPYVNRHRARDDAMATAWVAAKQRMQMVQFGWRTYRDLATRGQGGPYAFQKTLNRDLPPRQNTTPSLKPLKPRVPKSMTAWAPGESRESHRREYAMAVFGVVADLQVSPTERNWLMQLRQGLVGSEIAASHAQVLAAALSTYAADSVLDDAELTRVQLMHECLFELGWAPGMAGVVM